MSNSAIRVENVGKSYTLGYKRERQKYTALRDVIADSAKGLARLTPMLSRSVSAGNRSNLKQDFWALQNISFEVKEGDCVGVIGRNGAGKSTLLKLLSRITEPTTGRISIRGRVASLLEVGTGFHPELTGRENIYLNGAILGMSKTEIRRKFDEIVDFAEVERFLDTPVKRYSSGMYVRLAFAVAANLESEVLIVDEVLAVGDAKFQKKCLGKMESVGASGRTVLFVSHNMASIQTLCTKGIVLDKGELLVQDTIESCIEAYQESCDSSGASSWIRPIDLESNTGLHVSTLSSKLLGSQPHHTLSILATLESTAQHKPAFLAVDIYDIIGVGIMQAIPKFEGFIDCTQRQHSLEVAIQLPPLVPGRYSVSLWVGSHNTETLDQVEKRISFEVTESPTSGRSFPHTPDHGYIVPFSSVEPSVDSTVSLRSNVLVER